MNRPTGQLATEYRPGQRVSEGDFRRLCAGSPDFRHERTAEGTLIMMAPAGSGAGRRNAKLTAAVTIWATQGGRGEAFDSSAGFPLPNRAIRASDASWIAKQRWKALTAARREDSAPICPDLVAELRSRSDVKAETRQKLTEYLEQGARLGWLVDPLTGTPEIDRPGRPVEILERPSELSGEAVLPGFVLDLGGILHD